MVPGRRALEDLVNVDAAAWRGRRVLVTGHTGFKGGWLSLWLASLGAKVSGYSLDPPTDPSFFELAKVRDVLVDRRGDIRDARAMRAAVEAFDPQAVFHLAAQPIVKEGYRAPLETYATHVVGTASVLDACRHAPSLRAVVVVTTDKVYENREQDHGYVETDALGGHDPYSNSKACAELVTESFRRSYFAQRTPAVGIATARAGNVIGGGDWAADRLIPDLVRSIVAGSEAAIRNPESTRPWQHVLEPLHGYLLLAQRLATDPGEYSEPWNFGPEPGGDRPVKDIVRVLGARWPALRWRPDAAAHPHEAGKLMLDSTKAHALLGWRPRLAFDDTLRLTAQWYERFIAGERDLRGETEAQLRYYSGLAA